MVLVLTRLLFRQIEAFAEPLDTASRVKNTLLPGEERMAFGAHVRLQDRFGTHGFKCIPTGAAHCGLNKFWMYSLFHGASQFTLATHHERTKSLISSGAR
jgi:hypothetical protein